MIGVKLEFLRVFPLEMWSGFSYEDEVKNSQRMDYEFNPDILLGL